MASVKKTKRDKSALEDRFIFVGDAVAAGNRAALRPTMFSVEDLGTGAERIRKLWLKTGTPADDDLRQLWRHEMRQVKGSCLTRALAKSSSTCSSSSFVRYVASRARSTS